MISGEYIQVFKSFREGRTASNRLISRPDTSCDAIFCDGKSISIFYTDTRPDCAIKKLTITDPSLKPERLLDFFDTLCGDKILIPMITPDGKALVAAPAGMLQKNTHGRRANAALAGQTSYSKSGSVLAHWLAKEVGGDVTEAAMDQGIICNTNNKRSELYVLLLSELNKVPANIASLAPEMPAPIPAPNRPDPKQHTEELSRLAA